MAKLLEKFADTESFLSKNYFVFVVFNLKKKKAALGYYYASLEQTEALNTVGAAAEGHLERLSQGRQVKGSHLSNGLWQMLLMATEILVTKKYPLALVMSTQVTNEREVVTPAFVTDGLEGEGLTRTPSAVDTTHTAGKGTENTARLLALAKLLPHRQNGCNGSLNRSYCWGNRACCLLTSSKTEFEGQ